MAKILNKDPVTYQRERDGFIRDLRQFHDSRGTPFRKTPKINGHEVDLYLLYVLVTAHGGWVKVNSRSEWESLLDQFSIPKSCVNSGVALKQIYLRFLDRYEKRHYLGEDVDRDGTDDEESRHRRWSARALHSVPLSYNHSQHNVAENLRYYNGLSTELYKASDYERLSLSLLSPLPNEQDFAINVCTLLSNEGKHTLRLDKCPRIINFLLAHAGVFNHPSLRPVFDEVYGLIRKNNLRQFWLDTLMDPKLHDFIDESIFVKSKSKVKDEEEDEKECEVVTEKICVGGVDLEIEVKPSDAVEKSVSMDVDVIFDSSNSCADVAPPPRLEILTSDRDLFCLGRSYGTQDYFGQRVLQVASILRNLSFDDDNIPVLARNNAFIRFAMLCAGSRWAGLHMLGLDMLGNVATEIMLDDPPSDKLTVGILSTLSNGLCSSDRAIVLASLEVLNKLSQRDENEDIMLKSLDQKVYDQVCSFLTLQDIMLLIYTLECLYSLSSLGEKACNCIVRVHGAIDTLVSLITVEAQSYGPKACILMRLVETVSGGAGSQTAVPTITTLTTAPVIPSSTPVMVTSNNAASMTILAQRQATPQRLLVGVPQPAAAVATPVLVTSQQIQLQQQMHPQQTSVQQQQQQTQQQQQHASQQAAQENEQFALAWLRNTYEPAPSGNRIEQAELYKQYLTACARVGRRGVIAPLHFPRCVRSVFGGTVGPNIMKPPATTGTMDNPSNTPAFYEGIKVRANPQVPRSKPQPPPHSVVKTVTPPPSTPPPPSQSPAALDTLAVDAPSPSSPILKAQLSAPPKPRENPKGDAKNQVQAHPHLSQALLGASGTSTKEAANPSSTSLIKSLLATKVTPGVAECMGMSPAMCASDSQLPPPQAQSFRAGGSSSKFWRCQPPSLGERRCDPSASRHWNTPVLNGGACLQLQVTQRQQQQRLLQQQLQAEPAAPAKKASPLSPSGSPSTGKNVDPRMRASRINGVRTSVQMQSQVEVLKETDGNADIPASNNLMSSVGVLRGRREPPQPPPPPLAPLSGGRLPRLDIEDSDSTGNNSVASSSGLGGSRDCIGVGTENISSTDDGENSLTSFEGILLNGIPPSLDIDAASNDSSSKDSARSGSVLKAQNTKSLMLADLLEKKVEKKEPPVLNGVLGKELRIGEKGLELVENHLDKVLKDNVTCNTQTNILEVKEVGIGSDLIEVIRTAEQLDSSSEKENLAFKNVGTVTENADNHKMDSHAQQATKRPAEGELEEGVPTDAKRLHLDADFEGAKQVRLEEAVVNGNLSPTPQTMDMPPTGACTSDGNMANSSESGSSSGNYPSAANLYAALAASALEDEPDLEEQPQVPPATPSIQLVGSNNIRQVYLGQETATSTASQQQLIVASPRHVIVSQAQLTGQQGGQVLITTAGGQIAGRAQVVLQQAGAGSQFILSPQGQYLSTGQAYVVAQPQSALGQGQTLLVTQTAQQGTPSKTIIILQPQTASTTSTHQKVVVTPQGQQVVVTQVPRPVLQSSTISNVLSPPTLVPTSSAVAPPAPCASPSLSSPQPRSNAASPVPVITKQPPPLSVSPRPQTITSIKMADVRPPNPMYGQPSVVVATEAMKVTPLSPNGGLQNGKQVTTTVAMTTATSTVAATSTGSTASTISSSSQLPQPKIQGVTGVENSQFLCEWRGCMRSFKSANEVYMHACESHCPMGSEEIQCLWERCDAMKRKRFSLMTHLYDRHCNADVLRMMAVRRRQLSQSGRSEIPPPQPPPPHPGYAPNAAFHAIKRHALEFVNPKEMMRPTKPGPVLPVPARAGPSPPEQDDNEGPVTKSIRLTASLILRNLVIYSTNGRRFLRSYEPHLAGIALSNVESSRTIAQVLYDMNQQTGQR